MFRFYRILSLHLTSRFYDPFFSLQLEIPLFTPSVAGTRDLHMKVMFSLHVRELSETSRSVKSTDLSLICTILVL